MPRKPNLRSAKALTIRDVAKAAGVSVGTVSKALNNSGQLREETRAAVRSVAERLRFRPNEMARNLSSQGLFTVGLISIDRQGRFSIPVLEGIEDALDAAKISVFLCNTAGDPARERQHVHSLLAKRVDGIIVTGGRAVPRAALDLEGEAVPVIYAFARVDSGDSLCLLPDDRGGGRLAGEHLAKLGRRRIAHISGPGNEDSARHRREGFVAALHEHGIALSDGAILHGSWSEAWGHEAVARLVASGRKLDAIFCGSDVIARGVVDALRDRGIKVPDDMAIIGFDNWEVIASATRPPLTTIDMNLHELGRQAGLMLLELGGKHPTPGVTRLPCSLVIRESCGGRAHAAGEAASSQPDASAMSS
jgi:LacI family transcriptional regulator